ncbi:gamma-tubulin complex component 2-like isoform X4 [Gossypium australe]|uniref:Gamma-tubulin complex component 2-like isoform X4 n=1 Tax=Gossypium australe TaxID=47621 RepID=A0A5B6VDR8_9ROSI|nr:gamma-tubulin complex component 2-like isoform X4 [Gossypium australe]
MKSETALEYTRFDCGKFTFIIHKVEKLKSLCLQYAAATQWLISSSIDIPKLDEQSDGSVGSGKLKSKNPSQM